MTEAVVTADTDSISDIQDYLQSFNKEIGDSGPNQNAAASSIAPSNEIYTIDGQKLTGNIVITDQVPNENADQSGQYSTFMVMNENGNQQYMLIMPEGDQAAATEQEGGQAMVVTADDNSGNDTANQSMNNNNMDDTTGKRSRSGMFRKPRIKEEVFDEDDNRNDISVYDFNELNIPKQNNSTVNDSVEHTNKNLSTLDEDDEEDFKIQTALNKHRQRHSVKTDMSKKSKGAGTLILNTSNTSNSGSLHICTYCNYTSTKRYLLSRHLKSHSEDRPHKCGICERGFKTLASLQNHVNTHTGVRPHQCKFCDAAFTTSGELVRHIRYRHTHEKPHRCTECDYASVELSKLKRHMRCHTGERPYQCPHCTYASPDTYKLKRHLRIHTGEKPYVCDVCHQRFTQSNSLKAHRLIHTGNKPIFKCEFCPTTCGRKTDLRIHVQKLHTSDKMLTCKRCDQSFPDRYQFKLHLKTHEGEKCFKCDLCSYASVSARHLESHMLIHTDQKPFICDFCALSFRQKQLLKRHKNLYHNPNYVPPTPKEKTHECSQCAKAFRHKGNLIRHMSLHDPDSRKVNPNDPNCLDSSQLIDDEIYEDEDDLEMPEDTSVSIVTDGSLLDSSNVGDGTIAITLDPQTQHLINSGNDQVMFVVQYPNDGSMEGGVQNANGQPTVVTLAPTTSTPRIISRGARLSRNTATPKSNDVQDLFDSVTSEQDKSDMLNSSVNQLSYESNETLEDQLQKRKDMDSCFGFKDEDDEDDIILSMPAVHGQ